MTRRGLQIGGQGRYLFEPLAWRQSIGEIVPDDRRRPTPTRWAVSWKHNQQFAPWLAGYVNYNRVSDDTYFADFCRPHRGHVAEDAAAGSGARSPTYGPWSLLARVQAFQTLQDPNPPPRDAAVQHAAADQGGAERDRLARPHLERHRASTRDFSQSRARAHRRARRALSVACAGCGRAARGSSTRAPASQHWQYDLNQPTPGVPDARPSVAVPITSVDAGLVFERDWSDLRHATSCRRSSRARCIRYIPFRNQNQLPVFDTVQDDFNFTQLFSENRFIGYDRVGDANQLALAVTSRLLDPGPAPSGCASQSASASISRTSRSRCASRRAPGGESRISWSARKGGCRGVGAERPPAVQLRRIADRPLQRRRPLHAGARQGAERLIYRYSRELVDQVGGQSELKQTYLSGQWPITDNWTVIGRWNYSLSRPQDAGGGGGRGVQWRVLGAARCRPAVTTTTQQTRRSIFVQLELNGLARVGTSPLELLRRTVPGYLRTNDPALTARPHARSAAWILTSKSSTRWHVFASVSAHSSPPPPSRWPRRTRSRRCRPRGRPKGRRCRAPPCPGWHRRRHWVRCRANAARRPAGHAGRRSDPAPRSCRSIA